ncbi:MAG: DsbA family protein [Candidatus Scalinduaceae bacterium]
MEARRAIKVAECARLNGKFSVIQEALINHQGLWDRDTLLQLAAKYGQDPKQTRTYLDQIDVEAQIVKDQQHAKERGIKVYPAITVNRQITANTDHAIRQIIEKILLEHSI